MNLDHSQPIRASHGLLHPGIIGATAALGTDPVDILARVLDIAGFAVDAVLRVDLKFRIPFIIAHDLVNACRAISLRRLGVQRQIDHDGNAGVRELEVDRLIFLVIGR